MAEDNRYQLLELDTPDGLQDNIVKSLVVHSTKTVDERGRQLWIYDETLPIMIYTSILLKKDASINDVIAKRGLAVCPMEKAARVVRTGDGNGEYHEARSGSIAIITPITHDKVPIWLAAIGEPFSENKFVEASKKDKLVIFPDTKFRLRVPYYLMVRSVRNV
ncbi:uncharacterized protein G6M90_00g027600 [Metarhizium brunneum]|uniref:Uncharacterized protein n=1 Tax=Metarhizium brunneum TaxID=500148 RepID=A0A7D5Z3I6_9HYPO|nr:hypothetical protein G6M90_00g027600 [Metarhizium brunneum]